MASSKREPSQFAYPRGVRGRVVGHFLAVANAWMVEVAIPMLKPTAGSRILEIGFGPGVAVRKLCRAVPGVNVCGVDPSEVMLNQALRRNRSAVRRGQADLRLGMASDLPWSDAAFDNVLSLNNAHLWTPIDAAMTECLRVLQPRGRMLIGFHIWKTRNQSSGLLSSPESAESFFRDRLAANGFVETTSSRRQFIMGTASFLLGRKV